MSKEVQAYICIDEDVSSVNNARNRSEKACLIQKELKGELWGLIMATPKDITSNGEDPITNLKERFEDIWDSLWDAFIDDYKYTVVADDAEYNNDSLVKKAWDEELKTIEDLRKEERERIDFFNKYRDVVSPYNFDDYKLYREYKEGNIVITEPFTAEQREYHLNKIEKRDTAALEEALKRIKKDEE